MPITIISCKYQVKVHYDDTFPTRYWCKKRHLFFKIHHATNFKWRKSFYTPQLHLRYYREKKLIKHGAEINTTNRLWKTHSFIALIQNSKYLFLSTNKNLVKSDQKRCEIIYLTKVKKKSLDVSTDRIIDFPISIK